MVHIHLNHAGSGKHRVAVLHCVLLGFLLRICRRRADEVPNSDRFDIPMCCSYLPECYHGSMTMITVDDGWVIRIARLESICCGHGSRLGYGIICILDTMDPVSSLEVSVLTP